MSKLWEALDIIRERGMCKNTFVDDAGQRVCARGALHVAYGQTPGAWWITYPSADSTPESDPDAGIGIDDMLRLGAVARELFPERDTTWGIAQFNNHPDTTQDDLELVFEKAAIRSDEVLSVA